MYSRGNLRVSGVCLRTKSAESLGDSVQHVAGSKGRVHSVQHPTVSRGQGFTFTQSSTGCQHVDFRPTKRMIRAYAMSRSIDGSRGRGTRAPGSKFFQFNAVFEKICQNHMLAPPEG